MFRKSNICLRTWMIRNFRISCDSGRGRFCDLADIDLASLSLKLGSFKCANYSAGQTHKTKITNTWFSLAVSLNEVNQISRWFLSFTPFWWTVFYFNTGFDKTLIHVSTSCTVFIWRRALKLLTRDGQTTWAGSSECTNYFLTHFGNIDVLPWNVLIGY